MKRKRGEVNMNFEKNYIYCLLRMVATSRETYALFYALLQKIPRLTEGQIGVIEHHHNY